MNRLGVCLVWTLAVICVALAMSCSTGTTPPPTQQASTPAQTSTQPAAEPSAQPMAASSRPAQPSPPPSGIASGQFSADPDLRCDLLEVRRVSGGALIIKWRIVNTSGGQQSGSLTASQPKVIRYDFSWPETSTTSILLKTKNMPSSPMLKGTKFWMSSGEIFRLGSSVEIGRSFRRLRPPRIKSA